ncbi:hypothetical protein GALMADRAFT_230603 [Galerina marginata CBS 339.88]|uniref:Secreted protein n=1 Tax=Galerina marginata (strain CBS 339.88) TaxID=685588 RepID=A0A067SPN5_GALM3|nr:hypothetical protein GALMADRAFT_230603 [Galerina marginata CBS 339.88]
MGFGVLHVVSVLVELECLAILLNQPPTVRQPTVLRPLPQPGCDPSFVDRRNSSPQTSITRPRPAIRASFSFSFPCASTPSRPSWQAPRALVTLCFVQRAGQPETGNKAQMFLVWHALFVLRRRCPVESTLC